MGYPVPANAFQTTHNGIGVAIIADKMPMIETDVICLVIRQPGRDWEMPTDNHGIGYLEQDWTPAKVTQMGGWRAYCIWLINRANLKLSDVFGGTPPPPAGDPQNAEELKAALATSFRWAPQPDGSLRIELR